MSDAPKPAPCPCGNDPTIFQVFGSRRKEYRVECRHCKACTKILRSEAAAVAAWNRIAEKRDE